MGTPAENSQKLPSLKEKSNKITNESVAKTRAMLTLMNECQDAGVNTLQNLYGQGEQLNRAEQGLDDTEVKLDRAAITLKNMKRAEKTPCLFLPCVSCFRSNPEKIIPDKTKRTSYPKRTSEETLPNNSTLNGGKSASTYSSVTVLNTNKSSSVPDKEITKKNKYGTSIYDSRTENQIKTTNKEHRFFAKIMDNPEEEEIEQNLGNVSNHLTNLKVIATNMGKETGRQNEQLDIMNVKADRNYTKLDKVTKTTKNFIKDTGTKSSGCCCCSIS